jgi:hypothetical protein
VSLPPSFGAPTATRNRRFDDPSWVSRSAETFFSRLGRMAYRHRDEVQSDWSCRRRFRSAGPTAPLLHAIEGCCKRKGKPLAREGRKATGLSELAGSPKASYRSLDAARPTASGFPGGVGSSVKGRGVPYRLHLSLHRPTVLTTPTNLEWSSLWGGPASARRRRECSWYDSPVPAH